ncbi:MAG: hypothetical protein U0R24_00110 [Solirubrobacterales bacterium]
MGVGYSVFSGTDPRDGQPYVNQLVSGNNGGPGSPTADGWVTYAMPDCAKTVYIDSLELLEQKYPDALPLLSAARRHRWCRSPAAVGERDGLRPDSRHDAGLLLRRLRDRPAGGCPRRRPGSRAAAWKVEADRTETSSEPIGDATLVPGEWVKGWEAGGGGYGNPAEREPELVLPSIYPRWVSREAAERDYGVIFTGDIEDESLAVDVERTRACREAL